MLNSTIFRALDQPQVVQVRLKLMNAALINATYYFRTLFFSAAGRAGRCIRINELKNKKIRFLLA